jgi:hypothetical protein
MPEGLDGIHAELLSALLRGETVEARIREMRLMPELVTDTINEAFFALIGDSVLECDGDRIRPVEDYREELAEILGGEKNE